MLSYPDGAPVYVGASEYDHICAAKRRAREKKNTSRRGHPLSLYLTTSPSAETPTRSAQQHCCRVQNVGMFRVILRQNDGFTTSSQKLFLSSLVTGRISVIFAEIALLIKVSREACGVVSLSLVGYISHLSSLISRVSLFVILVSTFVCWKTALSSCKLLYEHGCHNKMR